MFEFFRNINKPNPKINIQPPKTVVDYCDEIKCFLEDLSLSEIYICVHDGCSAQKDINRSVSALIFWPADKLSSFIAELAWECRVRLDPYRPFAGGVLPGRSWRWHAVIAPMSPGTPILVFRRQRFHTLDLSSFVFENTSADELMVKTSEGISLVIFGATGSGKTSLTTSLMKNYLLETRVGIAESIEEIPLLSNHWFRLVEVPTDSGGRGGVNMSRVLAEMMRLSPEVIVIGELRGQEAKTFADFARTGHGGVITTVHAGSFEDARLRLSALAEMDIAQLPRICGVYVRKKDDRVLVETGMIN